MPKVTGIRLARARRPQRLMRSDNLRPAPAWFTPQMVKQVIELAATPIGSELVPVAAVPTAKPRLELVVSEPPPKSEREQWLDARAAERRERRDALIEADRRAFQIAFDRGIAIVDLAKALGRSRHTVLAHTNLAGFLFGKRPPLADPLTLDQLLDLADPAVPLPELRSVRLARVRPAHEARAKRERRAAAGAVRRAEREAASAERRQAKERARNQRELDRAKREEERAAVVEERRVQREIQQAQARERLRRGLAASRHALPTKPSCEVETPPARQAARPAPSREPAPTLPPARAHPLPIKPAHGVPRALAYAQAMQSAVAHLRARHFTVRRHNVDEIIARWCVSGQYGLLSNEELIGLAMHHGLEVAL